MIDPASVADDAIECAAVQGACFAMRREWLEEVVAEIRSRAPDQILLTGDLTQIGTAEEIRAAKSWLEALGPPERITLVPGNHDTYASDSWPNLARELADYLPADGADGFPSLWARDGVAVYGLSSAVPTRPISACGLLGRAQIERLSGALAGNRAELKFLVLHHPPLPGMIQFRKRLRDAARLESVLNQSPVDVMLHGHRHRNQSSVRLGARTYCTAPASGEAAAFRQFDVTPVDGGHQLEQTLLERTALGTFDVSERESWQVSARG